MFTSITPKYLLKVFANRQTTCATAATILAFSLVLALQLPSARADTAAALTAIADTADRICGIVATQGETQSSKVSGQVNTELNGLARLLVSIGISGAGEIMSSSYQGVLQKDLL